MTYSYVRAFVFSNLLMQIRKLINNVDKDPNIGRVVPPCSRPVVDAIAAGERASASLEVMEIIFLASM